MDTESLQRINERLRGIEANLRRVLEKSGLEWEEPAADEGVPSEVLELVQAGDVSGATRRYRELTGAGLSEAHAVVSRLA